MIKDIWSGERHPGNDMPGTQKQTPRQPSLDDLCGEGRVLVAPGMNFFYPTIKIPQKYISGEPAAHSFTFKYLAGRITFDGTPSAIVSYTHSYDYHTSDKERFEIRRGERLVFNLEEDILASVTLAELEANGRAEFHYKIWKRDYDKQVLAIDDVRILTDEE